MPIEFKNSYYFNNNEYTQGYSLKNSNNNEVRDSNFKSANFYQTFDQKTGLDDNNENVEKEVKIKVKSLCDKFPIYTSVI